MTPNILYSYEEWLDKKKETKDLSSIEKISKDTAQLMMYTLKNFSLGSDNGLTNEEKLHKEYLEKSVEIRKIEEDYTNKTHEITFLYNSLSGKYGKDIAPIYTKIGKLKCELIKIENECNNIQI